MDQCIPSRTATRSIPMVRLSSHNLLNCSVSPKYSYDSPCHITFSNCSICLNYDIIDILMSSFQKKMVIIQYPIYELNNQSHYHIGAVNHVLNSMSISTKGYTSNNTCINHIHQSKTIKTT